LERGRVAFEARSWEQARELLAAADADVPLAADDLALLSTAAHLSGDDALSDKSRQRLFHRCMDDDDTASASRAAFFLGMGLMTRGETAQGGAWIGRAVELAGTLEPMCVEQGYVLVPQGLGALESGDAEAALDHFSTALSIGTTCGDIDLCALGRLGSGQSLINLGRITEGLDTLDRAMVAVVAEEVSPIIAGIVYCGVVETCQQIGDLRRSREWTRALSTWCDRQPELVPFRGRCLVHRSEVLQLDGSWDQSTAEARRACALLSDPPGQPPMGAALYQLAELQRLRGDVDGATETYRRASEYGRDPQPGLALLRLATGRPDAAAGTLARVLAEGLLTEQRPRVLAAHVEAALAAGQRDAAQRSADQLAELASAGDSFIVARARTARSRIALADHDAETALVGLREAARVWAELGAVYELARTRELIGRACALHGDRDTADLETSAAMATFERLGAVLDVARIEAASEPDHVSRGTGLTGRELEVLRHVATGDTNRKIAEELFISEKTVARHVANIFTKLGVSSRAAATAYAYEHDLQ
jgi:ATP/maltotriose-dependent transcriptional regulator MalT